GVEGGDGSGGDYASAGTIIRESWSDYAKNEVVSGTLADGRTVDINVGHIALRNWGNATPADVYNVIFDDLSNRTLNPGFNQVPITINGQPGVYRVYLFPDGTIVVDTAFPGTSAR
ncbi:MAG: hypothetical protein ACYDAR_18585, partial [Thermomicrobiales bacterium]